MNSLIGAPIALTLPDNALLQRYREIGAYTDCFAVDIPQTITQEEYVAAFYTTFVFKLERFVLKWAVNKPSTDEEAALLAREQREGFAAWSVEARAPNQLLMCDYQKRTRSWLMTVPIAGGTRLYFGSAITKRLNKATGTEELGPVFKAGLGLHRFYSVVLLRAVKARLERK